MSTASPIPPDRSAHTNIALGASSVSDDAPTTDLSDLDLLLGETLSESLPIDPSRVTHLSSNDKTVAKINEFTSRMIAKTERLKVETTAPIPMDTRIANATVLETLARVGREEVDATVTEHDKRNAPITVSDETIDALILARKDYFESDPDTKDLPLTKTNVETLQAGIKAQLSEGALSSEDLATFSSTGIRSESSDSRQASWQENLTQALDQLELKDKIAAGKNPIIPFFNPGNNDQTTPMFMAEQVAFIKNTYCVEKGIDPNALIITITIMGRGGHATSGNFPSIGEMQRPIENLQKDQLQNALTEMNADITAFLSDEGNTLQTFLEANLPGKLLRAGYSAFFTEKDIAKILEAFKGDSPTLTFDKDTGVLKMKETFKGTEEAVSLYKTFESSAKEHGFDVQSRKEKFADLEAGQVYVRLAPESTNTGTNVKEAIESFDDDSRPDHFFFCGANHQFMRQFATFTQQFSTDQKAPEAKKLYNNMSALPIPRTEKFTQSFTNQQAVMEFFAVMSEKCREIEYSYDSNCLYIPPQLDVGGDLEKIYEVYEKLTGKEGTAEKDTLAQVRGYFSSQFSKLEEGLHKDLHQSGATLKAKDDIAATLRTHQIEIAMSEKIEMLEAQASKGLAADDKFTRRFLELNDAVTRLDEELRELEGQLLEQYRGLDMNFEEIESRPDIKSKESDCTKKLAELRQMKYGRRLAFLHMESKEFKSIYEKYKVLASNPDIDLEQGIPGIGFPEEYDKYLDLNKEFDLAKSSGSEGASSLERLKFAINEQRLVLRKKAHEIDDLDLYS